MIGSIHTASDGVAGTFAISMEAGFGHRRHMVRQRLDFRHFHFLNSGALRPLSLAHHSC